MRLWQSTVGLKFLQGVCACIKYPILNDANIFEFISDIERCFRQKLNSFEHNLMSMFFLFRYRLVYNEELHLLINAFKNICM